MGFVDDKSIQHVPFIQPTKDSVEGIRSANFFRSYVEQGKTWGGKAELVVNQFLASPIVTGQVIGRNAKSVQFGYLCNQNRLKLIRTHSTVTKRQSIIPGHE